MDEPLDLKLSITKLRAAREKRERALSAVRHRALHRELGLVDDSPTPGSPGSPPSGTAPPVGREVSGPSEAVAVGRISRVCPPGCPQPLAAFSLELCPFILSSLSLEVTLSPGGGK